MQKFFAVIALVALLGVVSAELTNGSYAVGPKEVANITTDPQLVSAGSTRFASSGSSVLLQGVINDTTIAQKTINTKDLGASDNKTVSQTGFVAPVAGEEGTQAYDTVVIARVAQDNNKVAQIRVTKYKLSGSGATNSTPQDITSNTNNQTVLTLVQNSATVHPGTKKFYVAALSQDNSTAAANLVLVGVDVSGTSTTRTVLATSAPLTTRVSCAGIAGQKQLFCVWNNGTWIVGAKVDPSTNVAAGDIRDIAASADGQNIQAWSASNSYGSLIQAGDSVSVLSSNTNWTKADTPLAATSVVLKALPRDDRVALILLKGNAIDLQYLDRNGTANGTVVSLVTGLTNTPLVHQHSDGSLYVGEHTLNQKVVVGQVWGDTKLSASTLQVAVYACIALVAGLFVF